MNGYIAGVLHELWKRPAVLGSFWTGFHVAEARLRGKKEAVPMKLRVTEVFRREDGTWKLVHRHADMPREPSQGR